MSIFDLPLLIQLALLVVLFAASAYAFIDALSRRPEVFVAGDKLTKTAWLIILGLACAVQVAFWAQGPLSILHLASAVAALVYLVDVRPTLRSLTRR